jgi:hypothetical protein
MPSLLDDPEAYAFAAQVAEDERKKLGLQSLLGGIGGLLETPVSYVKERATALATDPIGDMKRTMQGTIDRANQRQQLQRLAYGDPRNPTMVTDQAAADQLTQDYLDMASTIMPMGMVAPKSGLLGGNAFDMSKADASDIFGAGAQKTVYKDPDSGGYIQVLTRPDYPASVLGLEVPEAFRRQGIGGRLQEQAIKDFPNMQGQVSSKAAARGAYKLGRRPVGKPDASLEDVFKMIDEDSSVNLVSPARQQEMSGAQGGLLSAVPTNDVADTLIYHGTTPSAAKAIEKSGFDVSKSADGTIWFTSNPNIGEVAASGKGAVVNRKLNESNLKLAGWDEIDKYSVDELVNMGYDGVKMPDGNQTTYQIFNPEKLKK